MPEDGSTPAACDAAEAPADREVDHALGPVCAAPLLAAALRCRVPEQRLAHAARCDAATRHNIHVSLSPVVPAPLRLAHAAARGPLQGRKRSVERAPNAPEGLTPTPHHEGVVRFCMSTAPPWYPLCAQAMRGVLVAARLFAPVRRPLRPSPRCIGSSRWLHGCSLSWYTCTAQASAAVCAAEICAWRRARETAPL